MIKFFRRIRQHLLSEGKTSEPAWPAGRYLKYAIGEIFLVVVGILIALQVSNWNERRKELLGIERLMEKFENELKFTIRSATDDINNSTLRDSIIKKVLNNEVSKKDYQNVPLFQQLLFIRFSLSPELDNMYKLIEQEEVLPDKYNAIIARLNRSSIYIDREHDAMIVLKESSERNSEFINMNYPWARKSDSLSLDEAYNYFLSNESYKSRLFTHWNKQMVYNESIVRLRAELFRILVMLNIIREDYEPSDLKAMFENLEQKPFKLLKSDTIPDDENAMNISHSPIIINWTNDTIRLEAYRRNGDRFGTGELAPKEIVNPRFRHEKLDTDYLRFFEVYKNDVLYNRYLEVPNGFLIIE